MSAYLDVDVLQRSIAQAPDRPHNDCACSDCLLHERQVLLRAIARLTASLRGQTAEVERRKALQHEACTAVVRLAHYARHLPSCGYEHPDYPGACDCGLAEVLVDLEAP